MFNFGKRTDKRLSLNKCLGNVLNFTLAITNSTKPLSPCQYVNYPSAEDQGVCGLRFVSSVL